MYGISTMQIVPKIHNVLFGEHYHAKDNVHSSEMAIYIPKDNDVDTGVWLNSHHLPDLPSVCDNAQEFVPNLDP